jgi:ectoine hydroxylase-related dioxygenase (phytanoyl-CoA dioxygenase family)
MAEVYSVARYPLDAFDFVGAVARALGQADLTALSDPELPLRTRETDQQTAWHRAFYDDFDDYDEFYGRSTLRLLYRALIWGPIAELMDCQPFYFQAVPTFRVHLPGNLAVGEFHRDADYGHPAAEQSFWLPLTPAYDTNSLWIGETAVQAEPGDIVMFDAVGQLHGNKINTTGKSRVSFDFRCVRLCDYRPTEACTVNTGLRFAPGGYYADELVS